MSIKVGDKFIIEIGAIAELPDGKKKYFIKPFESLVFDRKGLEQLERLDKATGNIYQTGFEDGKADATFNTDLIDELKQVEYIRGLEDAWKLARKIEMLTCGEVRDIFGEKALTQFGDEEPSVFAIINQFSYQESESMIKAYEEKKKAEEEIKIGDEVKDLATNNIGIVLSIGERILYITKFDYVYSNTRGSLEKTGRHFDEVEQLLNKLRGEDNE